MTEWAVEAVTCARFGWSHEDYRAAPLPLVRHAQALAMMDRPRQ